MLVERPRVVLRGHKFEQRMVDLSRFHKLVDQRALRPQLQFGRELTQLFSGRERFAAEIRLARRSECPGAARRAEAIAVRFRHPA